MNHSNKDYHQLIENHSLGLSLSRNSLDKRWKHKEHQPQAHNEYKRRTILAHGIDEVPPDINFSNTQHMIAGAMAGVVEHSFMYPVDTIKTRMQSAILSSNNGMIQIVNSIRHEGYLRMYSGLSAVLAGAAPSHALYFATYELVKDYLLSKIHKSSYESSILNPGIVTAPDPIITGIAGIMATTVHDAIATPLDVIKQRMQISAGYKNIFSCFANILKNEGIKAFYLSYPTTLVMNIPYTLAHFTGYETFKFLLHDAYGHPEDDHHDRTHTLKHLVAGGAAGALAAVVSNPFDVMKTRLQTQGPKEYAGLRDVFFRIRKEEGMRGFMRGAVPRMLYHAPSAAITWATYEYIKRFFKQYSK